MLKKPKTVKPGDANWHLPTNDYAFKALFADSRHLEITAGFLKDFFGIVVPPAEIRFLRDSSVASLAYHDDATDEELQQLVETIRDITIGIDLADLTVELQVVPQERFIWRAVHYLTNAYNTRYDATKGPMPDGRPRDRFRNLKPAWGMNIIDFTLFPDDAEPYRMYALRNETTAAPLPEAPLRLGFFEIPKQLKTTAAPIADEAARNRVYWALFFRTGKAPDAAPKYIHDAARIMVAINNNPKEARMLTATERYIADRDAQQAYAHKLGHAAGHAEGHAEGHAKGISEERTTQALAYLSAGVPIEVVSATSKISRDELEHLLRG